MGSVFLTGMPGSGKSTVVSNVIKILWKLGWKVGGILTPEVRVGDKRIGFKVVDLSSRKEAMMASVNIRSVYRVSKYGVDVKNFERIALPALDFAVKKCKVIVIDELGKMEFFSKRFHEKVYEILKLEKPLLAVVHRNYINEFRSFGELITVNLRNRDELPKIVVAKLCELTPSHSSHYSLLS